jgi:TonB-linked SusC/RagA family outer membrane protein
MKKLLLVSLCFLMLFITQVFAQNRTVTGTVTAKDDGLPIPGVTVKVKGTQIGTQTNTAGKFTLNVPPTGAVLVFSFIGYETKEVPANGPAVNVELAVSSRQLGEVIVTGALGIKRAEKENGYASTTVSAKDLTMTNETNIANGLTAKVAGLAVATVDNSIDPQIRITLRGNRSIGGNNTALIVVDGIPIPGGSLSSINPDDVESSTILKGSGAAALYGSEASNGAIIITTKKGTGARPTITYDNSLQLEKVGYFPDLQNQFGNFGGEPNYIDPLTGFSQYVPYENQLYGPAFDGRIVNVGGPAGGPNGPVLTAVYSPLKKNPIESFFNTGITEQNTITFSQGDAKSSFFMSAQNIYKEGTVPSDKSYSTRVSIRGTKSAGDFKADYSIGYTRTNISTYGTGYNGGNLYTTVMQWPAFLDIKQFSNPNTSTFGNPSDFYDAYAINPYWIVDDSRINKQRDVFLGNLKLTYSPTKWLDASYQVAQSVGIDQEKYTRSQVNFTPYSVSDPFGAGNVPSSFSSGLIPGQVSDLYQYGDGTGAAYPGGFSRLQGDAILNFHHTFFNDFKTNLILGNTVWEQYYKAQFTGSNNLLIQDFYNVNTISGVPTAFEGEATIRQIAYFGELNLGYKDFIFLDGTLRNEQDSRLNAKNRSFTYPSAKISFIPTEAIEALKNNKVLNYAKLYASFSKVGNISVGPYNLQNTYFVTGGFPYGSLGALSTGGTNYSSDLKPESIKEIELGAELSFFDSRLHTTITYYKQNSTNQTLNINTSSATGYSNAVINAGEIQSSGEEFELTGQVLTQAKNVFGWTLGGNLSINDSKVVSLLPNINSVQLGNNVFAVVGQPFPVYKGTDMNRDPQGRVIVDANTGLPSANPVQQNFGRTTPKYILGLNTQVAYKFISLSGVAEYRGGNIIYNAVGSTLNFAGSSAISASAGRQAFVYPNSVINTGTAANPVYTPNTSVNVVDGNYGFWQSSAYNSVNSPRVSSAAFWKLREVALNFKLDQFIRNAKFIKGLTVALTGRNLALWKPKSNPWGDPEFADTIGNGIGTTSSNQTPGTRLFGADLKVTF